MTWKSYALVSGATVVATWFASSPPLQHEATRSGGTAARQEAPAALADITREADRLRARLHPPMQYHQPARDPFRFGAARSARSSTARRLRSAEPVDEPLTNVPEAPTLRVNLSGIAEDTSGGTTVRTAVISTPDDVLLVKEGDEIAGQYRVTAISATGVELTRMSDGWVVRLSLRP